MKIDDEFGAVHDLFFIYSLYFNKQQYMNEIINHEKTADDIAYFERLMEDFSPIDDSLRLFFLFQR